MGLEKQMDFNQKCNQLRCAVFFARANGDSRTISVSMGYVGDDFSEVHLREYVILSYVYQCERV